MVVSRVFQMGGRSPWRRIGLGLGCAGMLVLGSTSIHAQGKLDARYEASVAGIQVGKGSWVIDIAEDQYSASASGGSTGLLKAVAGG